MIIMKKLNLMEKRYFLLYKKPKSKLLNELSKIKSDSYCVGGRHRSSTKNIYVDKTSKEKKYELVIVQFEIEKNSGMFLIILHKLKISVTFLRI